MVILAVPLLAVSHWWFYRAAYDRQLRDDRRSESVAELTLAVKLAGEFVDTPEKFRAEFTRQYLSRLNANIALVEGLVLPQKRSQGMSEEAQRLETLLNDARSLAAEIQGTGKKGPASQS